MADTFNKALGITQVQYGDAVNVYTSPYSFGQDYGDSDARQAAGMQAAKEIMPDGPDMMGNIGIYATPGLSNDLSETKRALDDLLSSNDRDVVVWDTETLGTSNRNLFGRQTENDFFDVTQISLHKHHYDGASVSAKEEAVVLAMQISGNTHAKLSSALDQLEKNPSSFYGMDEGLRRSIADLTIADNESYFGKKIIGGKEFAVMTGQSANKPSYKGMALSTPENIARARKGLALQSDLKYTNTKEQGVEAISMFGENNPVFVAHNVQKFDQGNTAEWMGPQTSTAGKRAMQLITQPHIDTLVLAEKVYNQTNADTKNNQLSTIFNAVAPKNVSGGLAHYAGDDTAMNGFVFNDELRLVKAGALGESESKAIQKNQLFISEKGTGSYYDSAFNRNRGQYDVTMRWDEKENRFVQNYRFQEASIVAGHQYEFLGSAGKKAINGVDHYGMTLRDIDSNTIKTIFRENQSELTNLFNENLTPAEEVSASRQSYIKSDSYRRYYDELFDPRMKYNDKDTIVKRLSKSYEILDKYDAEVTNLQNSGFNGNIEKLAIKNVQDAYNANEEIDSQYYRSYEKIEKTVGLKSILREEQDMWNNVIENAKQIPQPGDRPSVAGMSQNLYISNFATRYKQELPDNQMSYTYDGMKVIPMKTLDDKTTYLNVSDNKMLQGRIGQVLRKGANKNASMTLLDFDNMLKQIGGTMDDKTRLEIYEEARKEIRTNGNVSQNTIKRMTNRIQEIATSSDRVVSSVPGFNIKGATSNGQSGRAEYMSNLSSNKHERFQAWHQEALAQSKEQLSSETTRGNFRSFDLDSLSGSVATRLKTAEDVGAYFDNQVRATTDIFSFNQGGKKNTSSVDYHARIKETVAAFEANGFGVSLDYVEESDDMVLFFSEASNAPFMNNMTIQEKRLSSKVHRVSIPLYDKNGSVNINGTRLMNQYKAKIGTDFGHGAPEMSYSSTVERAFDELKWLPGQINKKAEDAKRQGQKVSMNDIVDGRLASYRHKMTNGQVSSRFPGDGNPDTAWAASSRNKNLASGFTMDISDYGDVLLGRMGGGYAEEFKRWQRDNDKQDVNFINSGWKPRKEAFNVRNKVLLQLPFEWNKAYGKGKNGIQVTTQGTNTQQFMSGKVYVKDQRNLTPLGTHNPATRDQILKTQNYHTMEQDSLERYLKQSGLSPQQIKRRLNGSEMEQVVAYDNAVGKEAGVKGVGMRSAYMNDSAVQEKVVLASKQIDKEIIDMQAQLASGKDAAVISKAIEELQAEKKLINSGLFSNYDGQMIVRESLAKAMVVKDEMNIRLKTGIQLSESMQARLAKENGDTLFQNGTLKFKDPIGYAEMQEMGLITDEGLLKVGDIVEESMRAGGDEATKNITAEQKYRVYKDSKILGISQNEKGTHLILEQVQQGHDGTKGIDGFSGGRTTMRTSKDSAFDRIFNSSGGKRVDAIQEQINTGRNPWGGMLAINIETDFQNMLEDLENVSSGGKANLPAVRDWLGKGGKPFSTQDLNREDVQAKAFADIFQPHLATMGLDKTIAFDAENQRLIYGEASGIDELTGIKARDQYKTFLNQSRKEFGFDESHVYTQNRWHNVFDYAGTSTTARISIREMNVLKSKLNGADNPIYKQFEDLSAGATQDAHNEYGRRVRQALGANDISAIKAENNVLFDMTGSVAGSADANIRKVDGHYVFDATLLKDIGRGKNRSKIDDYNTMADPMTILLNNKELGIENEELGSFLKRNNSQAFLQTQIEGQHNPMAGDLFAKTYVPMIGNIEEGFSEYEGVNPRKIQKDFESVYSSVYAHNNRNYSSQDLSRDDIQKAIIRDGDGYRKRANAAMTELVNDSNQYLSTSSKSGFLKGTGTMHSVNGFSAKAATYNQFGAYAEQADGSFLNTGKRLESEAFMSKEMASHSIKGIEKEIFLANGLNPEMVTQDEMHEEILRRMTGTREKGDTFDVIGMVNRQPTQSEGSLNFLSMRIDENLTQGDKSDNSLLVSRQAAKAMGADYDGDTLYAVFDAYRGAQDPRAVQRALARERDWFQKTAKATVLEPGNFSSFQKISEMTDGEAKNFFQERNTELDEVLNIAAKRQAGAGIGMSDNAMVASRDMMHYVYSQALKQKQIGVEEYNYIMNSYDEVGNLFVQNFIDAKKANVENMGIDINVLDGLKGGEKIDYLMSKASSFMDTQSAIPGAIKNLTVNGVDDLMEQMQAVDVIPKGKEELFRAGFTSFAQANEATAHRGSLRNDAFSFGRSSGDSSGNLYEALRDKPNTILGTDNVEHYVSQLSNVGEDAEVAKNYYASRKVENETIVQNLMHMRKKANGGQNGFSDAADQQFNRMSDIFQTTSNLKENVSSGNISEGIKGRASKMLGSASAAAGAGFAAMWLVGSAIKGGPTPEGNEAQQEATPVEVNPAALLTSPTARVTPRGENIRLNVSGNGNVDQETISGIINQQVSSMTGVPMNMNVNITDNTQALDRSFYEKTMNSLLGF